MLISQYIKNQFSKRPIGIASFVALLAMLLWPVPAKADVSLTRADVDAVLNRVELIPRGSSARPARLSDFLGIGDALRTAAASRAELRFNDGSLARVGERATFRFTPNTRNFRLSNGTVLLMIPPGQGRTTIQTPNAVTGIQGSALVVRHIPGRNLTLVMALTNNPAGPMTVTTQDGSQASALQAGQMALIEGNSIQIAEFDLNAFYQTSDLIEGLYLDDSSFQQNSEDPLQAVRQETLQALSEQVPFSLKNSLLDPRAIGPNEAPVASSGLSNERTSSSPSAQLPPGLVIPIDENAALSTYNLDRWNSANSGRSNDPGSPATSATPANPSGPAIPATPGGPGTPATPATPATPGSPAIPATPADPGGPGTPATPATPADPANPGNAGDAATPATSTGPANPADLATSANSAVLDSPVGLEVP